MKKNRTILLLAFLCLLGSTFILIVAFNEIEQPVVMETPQQTNPSKFVSAPIPDDLPGSVLKVKDVKPMPNYLQKSIDWLSISQRPDGSWGAGSHAHQRVTDPNAVSGDPATTAFAAMALLRTGSTPKKGKYADNVSKALDFILGSIEKTPKSAKNITQLTGTQPQVKLGQNIDLSMTLKFLTRSKTYFNDGSKKGSRISIAMDRCIAMLESNQSDDGSWNDQAWAPVLQSAMANAALEEVVVTGYANVSKDKLKKSRNYQKSNITAEGKASTGKAAGIDLYTVASTQRATALETAVVEKKLKKRLKNSKKERNEEEISLMLADEGYDKEEAKSMAKSYSRNKAAEKRMADDVILKGFGNNGGEEFLSFMMTSESMVESGDDAWNNWHSKMDKMLGKVQNGDGSWSGHHCITSPVFCTTAVIMTLTADRDQDILQNEQKG